MSDVDTDRHALLIIKAAYDEWMVQPDAVVRVARSTDGGGAIDIDVLFWRVVEGVRDDDEVGPFTYVATAGLGAHALSSSYQHIELFMQVKGRHSWEEVRELTAPLVDVASRALIDGRPFAPDEVVPDVTLPLYAGRTALLVRDPTLAEPEWLPHTAPSVRILKIQPLYPGEASVVADVGAREAYRRSRLEGIDLDRTARPPALLYEYPAALVPDILAVRGSDMPNDGLDVDTMALLWQDIEAWCSHHAPRTTRDLCPSASEQHVQRLEALLSCLLPDDYRASLRTHNGDADLGPAHYLSADGVWRAASAMLAQEEAGAFAERRILHNGGGVIHDRWWHRAWVPVAREPDGTLLCLDLDPAPDGLVGQVIRHDAITGPVATRYRSFEGWLRAYHDDLLAGRYHVDADGYIAAP